MATLVVPVDDPGLLRVAVATGDGEAELRGMEYPLHDTLVALAMDTGRGVRVGALGAAAGLHGAPQPGRGCRTGDGGSAGRGCRTARGHHVGASIGTTQLHHRRPDMAEAFANHAALARELVEARANQQRLAVLEDRDRIARDLHDHVIQRLFAAGLSVQSLARAD